MDCETGADLARLVGLLIEAQAEQSTSFSRICEFCGKQVLAQIEAGPKALCRQRVGIHCDDILVADRGRMIGAELEGLCHLAIVYTVEQVAVVNKETGSETAPGRQVHQHQVEAEDLHVCNALTSLGVDPDLNGWTVRRRADRYAAGLFIKGVGYL